MRIAVGQLWQETNTFNPVPTMREDFQQMGAFRGAALVEQMAHTNELGGFIQTLRQWPSQPEIVGLVRLAAWPSGTATNETFSWLYSEFQSALQSATPVDGVLLALHGAMVAEGHPDVEGELLKLARSVIGDNVPLVATLDLHANVTREMVQSADALVLYHCMPHVDTYQTGERAANVLHAMLTEKANPITAWQYVPAVLPAERADTEAACGFAVNRKRKLQRVEDQIGVLTAGVAVVQPWLDIPNLGSAAYVTTNDHPQMAQEICTQLADELWKTRREYLPELMDAPQAVSQAHRLDQGLTVLSDAADATTSGAPGDSVWLLKELLQRQWARPVLVPLVAPHIVQQAEGAGERAAISVHLGGVRDSRFGTAIQLDVTVEKLFEARFRMTGHIGNNMPINMGPSVVLSHGNVYIVVTSRTGPHFAPELFQTAGFDPFQTAVVVAKSPCGFRAVYAQHARQIISVKAPGCAPSDFWNYDYRRIPHPLWPWDEFESWRPDPVIVRRPR